MAGRPNTGGTERMVNRLIYQYEQELKGWRRLAALDSGGEFSEWIADAIDRRVTSIRVLSGAEPPLEPDDPRDHDFPGYVP